VDEFRERISHTLLNDGGGRNAPLITNLAVGPDWISGGCFFIRNRRQPNLYWWVDGQDIRTSDNKRTKFRIELLEPPAVTNGKQQPLVLVRKDRIKVTVPTETGEICVDSDTGSLILANTTYPWTFGDLINNNVGVRFEGDDEPELVLTASGAGDEWELC
jgi:hypothetical protein